MFGVERHSYEYLVTILNVKINVKFPCRMNIEKQGSLLTNQVEVNETGRYVFNQQVKLKNTLQKQYIELVINILTSKQAKYTAGIIRLYHEELVRSQGQRLILSLSKCFDNEALCEINVEKVIDAKDQGLPFNRTGTFQSEIFLPQKDKPIYNSLNQSYENKIIQARSQYQFSAHQNQHVKGNHEAQTRNRFPPFQSSNEQNQKQVSRKNYSRPNSNYRSNMEVKYSSAFKNEKILQAQVYKEGYQKLRQRYKKQIEVGKQQKVKRQSLEKSQSKYRLQIMRLKLKTQQLQTTLKGKDTIIKDSELEHCQQENNETIYLREQINKNNSVIKLLEDRISEISKDNQELKLKATERAKISQKNTQKLQATIQKLKLESSNRTRQLQQINRTNVQSLEKMEFQLIREKDHSKNQKNIVINLERQIQDKKLQFQRTLQNQRNTANLTIIDQKDKILKLEKQISTLEEDKKDLNRQIDRLHAANIKIDYEKKLINEQIDSFKFQLSELKRSKQNYSDLMHENRSIIDQKNQIQKQLEASIKSKDMNLSEATKHFREQLDHFKKINRELDQKTKNLANKVVEVQGQLQISKNKQEKLKTSLQISTKQSADAKQKEKLLRKTLNSRSQQILGLEKEAAVMKQKLKNIDQICKNQIYKSKDQTKHYKIKFETQQCKVLELTQKNTQLILDLNNTSLKFQLAQEKALQNDIEQKSKKAQVQIQIKKYQDQISALSQIINSLILSEKQLRTQIKMNQKETVTVSDIHQKQKKSIRTLEDKCSSYELTFFSKAAEFQATINNTKIAEKKLRSAEVQLKKANNQLTQIAAERDKINIVAQVLQQQVRKFQIDLNTYVGLIFRMQKKEQQLQKYTQTIKEQYSKMDNCFTNFKKQTMKNKDSLFETIEKYLLPIPSQLNLQSSHKDQDMLLHKTISERSFAEAGQLIINQSKDLKLILTKQIQRVKQLERQNTNLQEKLTTVSTKFYQFENALKQQTDNYKTSLQQMSNEKELEAANYLNMINELKDKIYETQQLQSEFNTHIDDLNYINNNLKSDYETLEDYSNKKTANLKRQNVQLQQRIQDQLKTIIQYDQKLKITETQVKSFEQAIESYKQQRNKLQLTIQQLNYASKNQQMQLDGVKKSKTELNEKIEQLQMYLNSKQQIQQKTRTQLEEQQKKVSELKQFIHTIMKQKEISIKNQIELNELITNLENTLFQANRELESLRQLNQNKEKDLISQKQSNNKLNSMLKECKNQINEQKLKNAKIMQKIKQKQKQIVNKSDLIQKMEEKNAKIIQKHSAQIKLMKAQLDQKDNYNLQIMKNNNQQLNAFEMQIQKKLSIINLLQSKIVQLQLLCTNQKNNSQTLDYMTLHLQKEKQELAKEISQMQVQLNNMTDQLKQKQQLLLQYSNTIYSLEKKLEQKNKGLNNIIQKMNTEWMVKQEELCEQYEQKIKMLQKQKNYYKAINEEKDRQISNFNSMLKSQQISQINNKKNYEQKIQKIEREKLAIFSNKNSEISRLTQQNKSLAQNIKTTQLQIRKISHQLQISKKDIYSLQERMRKKEQKMNELNKNYQKQIEELKKRQTINKQFREMVNVHQWNTERQIKKIIQSFIRNYLELGQNKNQQKIVQLAHYLQKTISEKLTIKLNEK